MDGDSALTASQHSLIGKFYAAALDDTAWGAVCSDFARAFGAAGCAVMVQAAAGKKQFLGRSDIFSDAIIASYEDYFWQCDVWAERASQQGLGQLVSTANIISDSEFESTQFYADDCRQLDLFYAIGTVFPVADGHMGLLGIHRARGQRPYTAHDQAHAAILLPHLQRALQVRHRLASSNAKAGYTTDALDALSSAVVLIDAQLNVHFANAAAHSLLGLKTSDSLYYPAHGPVWTVTAQLAQAVRASTGMAHNHSSRTQELPPQQCQTLSLVRHGAAPLQLTVAPFRRAASDGDEQPCAMLIARELQAAVPSLRALQQLFALTPSESQVCQALARGLSPEEIARDCGISIHTVKTHLHHVFGKTGTRRQGELIALVLQCSPL